MWLTSSPGVSQVEKGEHITQAFLLCILRLGLDELLLLLCCRDFMRCGSRLQLNQT